MDDTQSRIRERLVKWRDLLLAREYPGCGFSMTAPMILSDDNISVLADCAAPIRNMADLTARIRWIFAPVYGEELIEELARIYDDIGDLSAVTKPPEPKKRSIAAELFADEEDAVPNEEIAQSAAAASAANPGRGRGRGSGRGRGRKRGRAAAVSVSTTPARRGRPAGSGQGTGRGRSNQSNAAQPVRRKSTRTSQTT